jgi:hypothetical protein
MADVEMKMAGAALKLVEDKGMDKQKALETALGQIERNFGKGSIMRLGEQRAMDIEALSTGSLSLDVALGIGGLPRGRIIEIYGPESSGKTTLALHVIAEAQKSGGVGAFIDAEHALDPVYAGKLGVESGDTDWFAAMVKHMGEQKGLAFFRKLAETQPQVRSGHTLMAELVSSGEVPIAVSIYNHNMERLAVRGAPVKWKALTPTFGRPNAVGVVPRAPNPHAALLFADYLLSRPGQLLIRERNRAPSSLSVETPLNKFPFEMIDPIISLDENDKWEKLYADLFLKGQKVQRGSE